MRSKMTMFVTAMAAIAPLTAYPASLSAQAAGPIQAAPVAASASTQPGYVLGAGDKLRITVFGEDNLTGEYSVTDSGAISFPLIGNVQAVGHTLLQLQEAIRSELASGYLKDPRVAVEVEEYRTFYILGEVNKPGEYPYRNNLTLEQAVATAGGYTYRANTRRFAIRHPSDPTEQVVETRDSGKLRIVPGDTIRIRERFF